MKKTLISVIALGAIVTNIQAGCVSQGWCADVEVTKLLTTVDGNILVGTSGNEATLGCGAAGGEYTTLSKDDAGQKNIYSLLLTAKTTKSKVMIRVDNTCKIIFAY